MGVLAAAAWLLADKCCVAAHLFGPQHRYCLRAIGRLCREDVREAARPARAALRRYTDSSEVLLYLSMLALLTRGCL